MLQQQNITTFYLNFYKSSFILLHFKKIPLHFPNSYWFVFLLLFYGIVLTRAVRFHCSSLECIRILRGRWMEIFKMGANVL